MVKLPFQSLGRWSSCGVREGGREAVAFLQAGDSRVRIPGCAVRAELMELPRKVAVEEGLVEGSGLGLEQLPSQGPSTELGAKQGWGWGPGVRHPGGRHTGRGLGLRAPQAESRGALPEGWACRVALKCWPLWDCAPLLAQESHTSGVWAGFSSFC